MNVVIFGSGKHAQLVSNILNRQGNKIIGHIDIIPKSNYCNIIGQMDELEKLIKKFSIDSGIIAVGLNYIRIEIMKKVISVAPNFKWISCIDDAAYINNDVQIGSGVTILGNASILGPSKIGNHVIINSSTSINHHNNFADFSSTGPGVTTGGSVSVGFSSYLGIASVIKNEVKIGDYSIIGASSFVNKDVDSNILGYGTPFRKVRKSLKNENYL